MVAHRATMGHDWGGRTRDNPPGSKRVSSKDVREMAEIIGINIRREGQGWSLWQWQDDKGGWRNLATTNYLALERLTNWNKQT